MRRKSGDLPVKFAGEIEHKGGKVLQRRRCSGGNVRLSHLLMTFLCNVVSFHMSIFIAFYRPSDKNVSYITWFARVFPPNCHSYFINKKLTSK